jgi:ATP synthase in type III secretion protein N
LTPFYVDGSRLLKHSGVVTEALGTVVRVRGVQVRIGELCTLTCGAPSRKVSSSGMIDAEVVGIKGDEALLMPFGGIDGIGVDAEVRSTGSPLLMPVGPEFIGRVVDARGVPIDDGPAIKPAELVNLQREPPSPMRRSRIDAIFQTGVRSIDALCSVGSGQRMGIFAPAGVGKSVLMGMLAKYAKCDVVVMALIGERGREVREFVEDSLGANGMKRAIVVVATADAGPIERTRAAFAATALAEYFRDCGKDVLLMLDSLTRFARAQREIGLARGEPPTRRGYPPSLFSVLPQLLERAGNNDKGRLTSFYTVLMEDESSPDPVAEEVRSLLDGHLVLTRRQAERGIFPALDPNASLSRLMKLLVHPSHSQAAGRVRELLAKYADAEMLIQVGEYKRGNDPLTDDAIDKHLLIDSLLSQGDQGGVGWYDTIRALEEASGIKQE